MSWLHIRREPDSLSRRAAPGRFRHAHSASALSQWLRCCLIPFAEVWSRRAFLPRNWRADHRTAVNQRCRCSADMGIHNYIEAIEVPRTLELLLREICIWYGHLIESEANPSLVLCFDPRVEKANSRDADRVLLHRGYARNGRAAQTKRGHDVTSLRRRILDDESAGWVSHPTHSECCLCH